jgi:hypothetical protein
MSFRPFMFLTLLSLSCATSTSHPHTPAPSPDATAAAAGGAIQSSEPKSAERSCEPGSDPEPPKQSWMIGAPARWELKGEKHLIAVIYQNHVGAIEITIDPNYRYQWARMTGAGVRDGSLVTQEFYEISTVNLWEGAAAKMGWRNPLRLDRFIVPVMQFTGRRLPDRQSFVDVKYDGASRYLIITTKIEVQP